MDFLPTIIEEILGARKVTPQITSKQLPGIRMREPYKKEALQKNLANEIASERKGSSLEY